MLIKVTETDNQKFSALMYSGMQAIVKVITSLVVTDSLTII